MKAAYDRTTGGFSGKRNLGLTFLIFLWLFLFSCSSPPPGKLTDQVKPGIKQDEPGHYTGVAPPIYQDARKSPFYITMSDGVKKLPLGIRGNQGTRNQYMSPDFSSIRHYSVDMTLVITTYTRVYQAFWQKIWNATYSGYRITGAISSKVPEKSKISCPDVLNKGRPSEVRNISG